MKTLRLIGTTLLAITLFASCGGGDDPVTPDKPVVPEKPDKPKEPSITVPSGEDDYFSKGMNFDTNAGEKSFSFQTDADWTISVASTRSGESWCSVSPISGKAGKHTVKVKTEANTTYDNRQVTLTLAAGTTKKTIAITQKQQDALTLTKDKFEVDAKGGTIEVEVKANISYDVIIPETSKGWISKSTKSRGLTASTLVFNIAESEESEKREGEIIIKSGEITETIHVYQSGQKILLLSQNEFNVTAEGDTIKVELRSNIDFGVKMPEVDWISELKGSRAASSHTLYYIIKANETYNQRNANIVFFDKNSNLTDALHIVQFQKDALIVGQKEFNVKAEGEDIQIKLSHNVEYDIDINDPWITQAATRGLTESNLTFTIKPNNTEEERIGKITFTDKNKKIEESILVYQSRKGNAYHIAKAGTLSELIGEKNKFNITELTLSGELNGTDIRFIREMIGRDVYGKPTQGMLSNLDLYEANIVEGGDFYYKDDHNENYTSENSIGDKMFSECRLLLNIRLPKNLKLIGGFAFDDCMSLNRLDIPKDVISIGYGAFIDCREVVHINLPHGLREIGSSAFEDCRKLVSIDIPGTVTSLGYQQFYNCFSLKTITFKKGIEDIDRHSSYAEYCRTLYLPRTLKHIGKGVLPHNLSTIYIFAIYPPILEPDEYLNKDCKIYVPKEALRRYKTSEYWEDFWDNIYEMPEGVTEP